MIIEPNSTKRPHPGTVITRPKGIAEHSAISLGGDKVFENVPGGARITSWAEFSQGYPVTVRQQLNIEYSELWRRAYAIVAAKRPYHLTDFNCDDAVNLIANAIVRPSQIVAFAVMSFVVLGAVGLFMSEA